jgi:hypothetical protein
MTHLDALDRALSAGIGASSEWFRVARERAAGGSIADLLRVYTEASRHLGRTPLLQGESALAPSLQDVRHWSREDAGRLLLLLARYEAAPEITEQHAAAALECYEQGDAREQESWLRTVAWLPEAQRFLPTVIDACRTSILPLFEAVACENPYPARYFPERNFNQLVLKALFNGVALKRVAGLRDRLNPDLTRMAQDYAAERRAAGRSIPEDISLAMMDGEAQRIHP